MLSRRDTSLSPALLGSLYYFGFYGAAAAYMPFLSVFFAHQGLTGSEIGLLAALGPVAALVVTPMLAALADRRGWRRRLLCFALGGTALSLVLLPLPHSFAGFVPPVLLLALVSSPNISLADGLIAPMAARHELDYGKMRLWGSVSWSVMATLGGALWQQAGLSLMFPLAGALFAATILVARLLHEERTTAAPTGPARAIVADSRFRILLLASLAIGVSLAMAQTFLGIYMDRLSGQMLVGAFAGVAALSEPLTMLWSGRIVRRLGGPRTLLLGYLLMSGAYLGVALIREPILLLTMAFLRGLGYGLFAPTTIRLVAGWAPPKLSATAQGLLNAGLWGLAPLLAGPLGGVIYDAAGPPSVFLACAIAATLAGTVIILAQVGGVFRRAPEYPAAVAAPTSTARFE